MLWLNNDLIKTKTSIVYQDNNFRSEFPCAVRINKKDILVFFRIADNHFATTSKLVYCISYNLGKTWSNPIVLDSRNLITNNSSFNCPSVIRNDKDIVLVCDEPIKELSNIHNESLFKIKEHFWVFDFIKGLKIKEHWELSISDCFGFNQDRILVLPNNKWLMGWHFWGNQIEIENNKLSENENVIQCVSFSDDQGKSWYGHRVIADKENANLCDGNIIFINNNRLGCFMRDHSFNGAPSYVSFSDDLGMTWSDPIPLPFAGHHCITKVIDRNILFSFYRDVRLVDGIIDKKYVGIWGTFFNIDDFSKHYTFEIENDGTLWQNCGWGDSIVINKENIYCYYYITANYRNPVIKQSRIRINLRKLKRKIS